MEDPEALLASMLAWARSDPRVTAVIQTGSRSRGERVDAWSDLDILFDDAVFADAGSVADARARIDPRGRGNLHEFVS